MAPAVIRLCYNDTGEERQHLKDRIRSACSVTSRQKAASTGLVMSLELSEQQLDYLANLDNRARLAWCAFIEQGGEMTGIGLARYMRIKDEPGIAEFAITVVDDYQHLGLGRLLLERLIESASVAGLDILRGYVRPGNQSVLALAKKLGGTVSQEDDHMRVDIPIARQPRTNDQQAQTDVQQFSLAPAVCCQ